MANIGSFIGFLLILISFEASTAQCPNDCTCSETEISCDGLTALPSSSDLFSMHGDSVQSVSITGSPGITEIPTEYFVELPKVETITLSGNGLTSLSLDSFKFLPMLTTIDLSGNPIVCDPNIHWIKEWLVSGDSNAIEGNCPYEPNNPTIADFTATDDFFPDMEAERLTFSSEGVIELNEDVGATSVRVERTDDTYALMAKVITVLNDGTTSDNVEVEENDLTFGVGYLYQDININVVDDQEYSAEQRGFTITVYADSIAVRQAKGVFTIIDNEVKPTTPKSDAPGENGGADESDGGSKVEPTMPKSEPTDAPSDTDENGDADENGGGSKVEPTMPKSEPTDAPSDADTTDKENGGGSKAWIIILVIIIIIIVIVAGVFLYKRMQDRKRTTSKDQNVGYSAVKPEGDAKVYSPTTEEVA